MDKKNLILGILLFGITLSQAQAAIIGSFSDRSTWEGAAGTIVLTDTFDNELHTGTFSGTNSFTLDSGIVSTGEGTSGGQCNGVTGGQFVGCIGLGNSEIISWTFILPTEVTAFGADIDLTVPGFITGDFNIAAGGDSINANSFFAPSTDGFLGFVSDTAFSELTFWSNSATAFGIDNLALASASVPEPSSLFLMGLGLVGIGLAKRKV